MFDIGNYNWLVADEYTSHGLFLVNESNPEKRILLPGTELSQKEMNIGDKILLFVYLDSENRPVATLKNPKLTLHHFAKLRIVSINQFGAFADWGMPKDLFIPYSELDRNLKEGDYSVVFLFFGAATNRLVGSTLIDAILSNEGNTLKEHQEVEIMVWKKTDLGFKVIIDNKHQGLIFHSEIFTDIDIGEQRKAFIKTIREDGKIDVSLQKTGVEKIKDDATLLYEALKRNNGVLLLHDKSEPEEIYKAVKMSKKAYKRAAGALFKSGKVILEKDRILMKKEQ
jgi:uncharacterized protein